MKPLLLSVRHPPIDSSPTIRIADLESEKKASGLDVVDFSAGRAIEHTPAYIVEAATSALNSGDTHQTMARGKLEFRKACAIKLARENGISADPNTEVIATLGCKQGLFLALMATLNSGDEVVVEDPGFVSYSPEIRYCGGIPVPVPMRWTKQDLEKKVTSRTRAILLCSPHNPTGIVHSREELSDIASVAEKNNLLVYADETYERTTWENNKHISIASLPGMRERTVTLMGLTKSFSMGGWRIGFNFASEPIIEAMLIVQQHLVTCATSFVQAGATAAYAQEPPKDLKTLWHDWEKRCRHASTIINNIPSISCAMPEGGFYAWVDVSELGEPSSVLSTRLLQNDLVAVVPGTAFGSSGEGFIRITCVRPWDELDKGLSRLKSALC